MKAKNKTLKKSERKNLPGDAKYLIANAANDITIPYFSGSLQYVDDTLIQRGNGKGLKIYDEIERDTHAGAMLQKRKKTLIGREWEVVPASDSPRDVEAAEVVRECLTALPFDRICEDLEDAILKGFAISEVVWKRVGARIMPVEVVVHDQRRFVFDHDWKPRLLTWTDNRDGIQLPDRKFIVHRHGVKGNNPYGLGLGTRLFWPVLFKREGITFWLHFLEKFAGPTVVAETPYGMDSGEQRKFLNTLSQLRTSAAITVPVGTGVKFLEAARSGSVTYQDFLKYWDKQISICVNGETLTTDMGDKGGARAASETHAEMLQMLVDSDGDLLSASLKEQLLAWIVEYNVPGAGVPDIWRTRAENELKAAAVRKAKAVAAQASAKALTATLNMALKIGDDAVAREFIVASGLVDGLSDAVIDALVEARLELSGDKEIRQVLKDNPAFATRVKKARLKKKLNNHVCFADPDSPVARITDQLEQVTARHFERRIEAIRTAITAPDFKSASRNLLELAASWTPDHLGTMLSQAMELAALEGREAVFRDGEASSEFADPSFDDHSFREQIDFIRQLRASPSRVWTDFMHGDHDRAFVVAGANDQALVDDFQTAILKAAEIYDIRGFAKDFDRLVEKYGWDYKGGRNWRIRTIFETNLRTSHMAGRLKQMRSPNVIKNRPYWRYRHGDLRTPLNPREQHLAWDGLILMHDDPFWDTHFPPNDWRCSCGVYTVSKEGLKRLGKTGPDPSPEITLKPFHHKASGATVMLPEGIGFGWDYQPGNLWERGLVPSTLIDEAGGLISEGRHAILIDTPEPIADLIADARPFKAEPLAEGLEDEAYVRAFLEQFGADIGEAVLFEDKAGQRMPISDALFRDRAGGWKVGKRDRAILTPLLAETLMDPDEIWIGLARKGDELVVDRRYIRVDPNSGLMVVFEIGRIFWEAITAYPMTNRKGRFDLNTLRNRRGGKLLFKRKKRQG